MNRPTIIVFVLGLTLAIQRVAAYGTIYAVIGKMLFGYSYLLNLLILLLNGYYSNSTQLFGIQTSLLQTNVFLSGKHNQKRRRNQ